jgi:hypothetical protein
VQCRHFVLVYEYVPPGRVRFQRIALRPGLVRRAPGVPGALLQAGELCDGVTPAQLLASKVRVDLAQLRFQRLAGGHRLRIPFSLEARNVRVKTVEVRQEPIANGFGALNLRPLLRQLRPLAPDPPDGEQDRENDQQ